MKKFADIAPALSNRLAQRREALAKEAEPKDETIVARDNYYIAAVYWATRDVADR